MAERDMYRVRVFRTTTPSSRLTQSAIKLARSQGDLRFSTMCGNRCPTSPARTSVQACKCQGTPYRIRTSTRFLRRIAAIVLLTSLALASLAQQSAAGYGQRRNGGQGGGMGGGGFGGAGARVNVFGGTVSQGFGANGLDASPLSAIGQNYSGAAPTRLEDDQTQGLWTVKSAVLTPGDQFSFKLKVEKGETTVRRCEQCSVRPGPRDRGFSQQGPDQERRPGRRRPGAFRRLSIRRGGRLLVEGPELPLGGRWEVHAQDALVRRGRHGRRRHGPQRRPCSSSTRPQSRVVFRLSAQKGKIYDVKEL